MPRSPCRARTPGLLDCASTGVGTASRRVERDPGVGSSRATRWPDAQRSSIRTDAPSAFTICAGARWSSRLSTRAARCRTSVRRSKAGLAIVQQRIKSDPTLRWHGDRGGHHRPGRTTRPPCSSSTRPQRGADPAIWRFVTGTGRRGRRLRPTVRHFGHARRRIARRHRAQPAHRSSSSRRRPDRSRRDRRRLARRRSAGALRRAAGRS